MTYEEWFNTLDLNEIKEMIGDTDYNDCFRSNITNYMVEGIKEKSIRKFLTELIDNEDIDVLDDLAFFNKQDFKDFYKYLRNDLKDFEVLEDYYNDYKLDCDNISELEADYWASR